MLSDYKNHLFFATPVLQEFEILNSLFQQTKADPHELYQPFLRQKSLQKRPYDAKRQKKNIQVGFSVNFLTTCKFLQQNNSAEAHLEIKKMPKKVYVYAFSQVTCRLPSARDTFENLSKLSLVIILNQVSRPMFSELSFI